MNSARRTGPIGVAPTRAKPSSRAAAARRSRRWCMWPMSYHGAWRGGTCALCRMCRSSRPPDHPIQVSEDGWGGVGDGSPTGELQGGHFRMALLVNTNFASINAQRHLEETGSSLNRALERLSSGVRINDAFDDAAGLAIADKLQRDVRVLGQAIRNANDGVSALAIGEKALGSVTDILSRLSELASQSATGTVTNTQRSAIQQEFTALLSEVGRLSNNTTFNGVQLLSAGTTVTLQVGLDGSTNSQISFNTVDGSGSRIPTPAQTPIPAPPQGSAQTPPRFPPPPIATPPHTPGPPAP